MEIIVSNVTVLTQIIVHNVPTGICLTQVYQHATLSHVISHTVYTVHPITYAHNVHNITITTQHNALWVVVYYVNMVQ